MEELKIELGLRHVYQSYSHIGTWVILDSVYESRSFESRRVFKAFQGVRDFIYELDTGIGTGIGLLNSTPRVLNSDGISNFSRILVETYYCVNEGK